MSSPPPIDPIADARLRELAAAELRSHHLGIAALATQFLLSFIAAAWAAGVADDGSGTIGLYAGVACVFALAGASAASQAVKLAFGFILALLGLPDFIKKVTTSPPPPPGPPDPRQQRQEFWLHVIGTGVHACVLMLLFLLVAVGVAIYGPATFWELAWRFAVASATVSLLTWHALKLQW